MLLGALLFGIASSSIAARSSPLHQPEHAWRADVRHLSSGAVVTLRANESAFLSIQNLATDIWQTRRVGGGVLELDVQVRHDWLDKLRALPGVAATSLEVVHPDLLSLITSQAKARTGGRWAANHTSHRLYHPTNDPFFDEYRPQDEIVRWMEVLATNHPELVQFVASIGSSVEGRPIPALTIGGSDSGPAIYFQATLHAREWITTATVLYIAAEMAASEEGSRLRELIRAVRFYVVPVANPDGYVWTWTGPVNRMLRKNRRPDPLGVGGLCDGVDLNRNYGFAWANGPLCASAINCLPTYHGQEPNSEPEVRATVALMDDIKLRHTTVLGAIDWHSYSQLILRPYGYICPPWGGPDLPPNDEQQEAVGAAMAQQILETSGMSFANDPSCDLYAACGTGGDYMHSTFGDESVAFTMELRPAGLAGGGFVLPDSEIRPSGQENTAATVVYGEELLRAWRRRRRD